MQQEAHWGELTRPERRRRVTRTVLHVVGAWVITLAAYAALPLDGSARSAVRLGVALILVALLVVWEVWRILGAGIPALRAIQALGTIAVVFLATFASAYLAMSHADPSRFDVPLDHVSAFYFTTTVFATVGFGDITPHDHLGQIVVTVQMLLDLVLIGLVVRVLIAAARMGHQRRGDPIGRGPDAP
ncbi:potassium channel family protein [Luteimicrobium sp. DT211]|uniref:potassium channel family protein n=1 Tax=Luteimicrobium sp. DT211 TaxID=3393412 RepID=UPI003CF217F6